MTTHAAPAAFDKFAWHYQDALEVGLGATGESKDYFAVGRINWLKGCLSSLGYQPSRILDFGCGTGTSIPLLRALPGTAEVSGVDISETSLQRASESYLKIGNVKFATPDQLPPAGNMNLAFCNGVFHHILPEQRMHAMRYIFECLSPGGIFAFWENNPWNPGTRYVMSRIPFDRDAITLSPFEARRLVKKSGFDLLMTRFLFFFPKLLNGLREMEPSMQRLPLGGQYVVLCRKPDR